ncbi:MAG: RIP metalloprotease RseP [Pseudomonadota bacterium]
MQFLYVLLAGIVVLGPLIAIHEFGHFWVARRCGVKVLTFSIGFGPALWQRVARDGTEYRLAAIPLGGYVRMLDEREAEVPEALLPQAFNRQPVSRRMAIVAAGPLINLLFAVLLYWILFLQPGQSLRPVVGRILPESPAAVAGMQVGDELLRINTRAINDWESANYALVEYIGDTGSLTLEVMPQGASQPQLRHLKIQKYLAGSSQDPFRALGFVPWMPPLPPVIGTVEAGSPADKAGLAINDRIREINDERITEWQQIVEQIQRHPDRAMTWVLERQSQPLVLTVTPDLTHEFSGQPVGRLGVGVIDAPIHIPPAYQRDRDLEPVAAFVQALDKTGQLIALSLTSLYKMLSGLIGVDALSGPITIVKVAGHSASMGWEPLVGFMALLSISLGVLNLLPIPVLDGGHLLYYAIEAVCRRPLPEAVQVLGLRVGVALMGSVMLLAILNDIRRLF